MNPTRICLIRHGETHWNTEKRIQGHLDIDLNPVGLGQAESAARYLVGHPVAALYSSDLQRARQTAERIAAALALPFTQLPEFRERSYGIFEGLTYNEARLRYPAEYPLFEARDADYDFTGSGESLCQFYRRVSNRLRALALAHAGQTVALVTHGGVLDIVNRFVRGTPLEAPRDFPIPNAGINWLSVCGDTWTLDGWAQTAHLEAGGLDELPQA